MPSGSDIMTEGTRAGVHDIYVGADAFLLVAGSF